MIPTDRVYTGNKQDNVGDTQAVSSHAKQILRKILSLSFLPFLMTDFISRYTTQEGTFI